MLQKILIIILFSLFVCFFGAYFLYGKDWIEQAYQNKPNFFFGSIIDNFYPRFWTEKHRFQVDFFINKANQVVLRLFLVISFTSFTLLIWSFNFFQFSTQIKKYFSQKVSKKYTSFLRIWLCLLMLYVAYDWIFIFQNLENWKDFYHPVFLLKIFGRNFPPFWLLATLWFIWLFSTLFLLFFNFYRIFFGIVCGTIFIFLQGFLYSFHKIDHTFTLLNYCLFLLPFLLYSYQKVNISEKYHESWALKLMQLSMISAYFLAGIEKILIGGTTWLEPNNIRNHIHNHKIMLGVWLSNSDSICVMIGLAGILFEILFPLIVLFQDYRILFLCIGVVFHLANFFVLGVGAVFHPWILLYVIWFENINLKQLKE